MNKFIVALIGFPVSFLIIYYRVKIKEMTGDIGFAEQYFGAGGTYTFIFLLGVLTFIGTLMYIMGTLQIIVGATIGKIF
ncbi:MAG: hypothetical protein ABH856_01440 [Patescibacteria group bacterium]